MLAENSAKMRPVENFVELYFSVGFTNKEILHLFIKNMQETGSVSKKECLFSGGGND